MVSIFLDTKASLELVGVSQLLLLKIEEPEALMASRSSMVSKSSVFIDLKAFNGRKVFHGLKVFIGLKIINDLKVFWPEFGMTLILIDSTTWNGNLYT